MQKISLLIIEDDTNASIWLMKYFESISFHVDCFETITDAISHFNQKHYDLVLLDLNLPDYDGFEFLKYLNRSGKNVPVIVLSAYSQKETIIQAFKFGASDYMKKPIDVEELEARVWVHLKNGFVSDFENRKLNNLFLHKDSKVYYNDTALPLTKIEKAILLILLQNKNTIIKREKLTQELFSMSSERTLDYHIGNLRKKIFAHTNKDDLLQTVYGVGYKLVLL